MADALTNEIEITQVFKVTRWIKIPVNPEEKEDLVERYQSGAEDLPNADEDGWQEAWDLQNEEIK